MIDFGTNDKLLKDNRTLMLKAKDGTKSKSSTGLVDPRVFTGENNLHVVRTPNNLWYFKYDFGGLPEPLKVSFTKFEHALQYAKLYFAGRNIEVVDVIA